jgi:hypothetical protein
MVQAMQESSHSQRSSVVNSVAAMLPGIVIRVASSPLRQRRRSAAE